MSDSVVLRAFQLRLDEGPSKVTSIEAAIRQHVQSGMTIYAPNTSGALLHELIRQFYGTKPSFTLACDLAGDSAVPLAIHAGLVTRLIFATSADLFPTPSPNPILQRAFREKAIELENWTTLTIVMRLMAGALGIGFMPTRSMLGTDAVVDNAHSFQVVDDPFGSGKKLGLVRGLNPDLALVHGLAADAYGNTITPPWWTASAWGARASRLGAVVTVEQLVTTDFIRKHSHMVTIPGYMVKAVVVAPFGAHPQYLSDLGLPGLGYSTDGEYLRQLRYASERPEGAEAWLQEWVLECPDHEAYLSKLGAARLAELRRQAAREDGEERASALWQDVSRRADRYNSDEWHVVAAARRIKEAMIRSAHQTMHAGIGISGLSGWLAYYLMRLEGRHVDMLPVGIGFLPRPGDPFLVSTGNIKSSAMICERINTHGTATGGEFSSCLGVLGAGQVDKYGNINSSKISDDLYLAGMAGGNDIASGAREVIVVARQSRARFLDKVTYVSQPGSRVTTLVSQLGIFEKRDGELTLTAYFPSEKRRSVAEHVQEIRENCGWELRVAPDLSPVSPPTTQDLLLLRMLDPEGKFIGTTAEMSGRGTRRQDR